MKKVMEGWRRRNSANLDGVEGMAGDDGGDTSGEAGRVFLGSLDRRAHRPVTDSLSFFLEGPAKWSIHEQLPYVNKEELMKFLEEVGGAAVRCAVRSENVEKYTFSFVGFFTHIPSLKQRNNGNARPAVA